MAMLAHYIDPTITDPDGHDHCVCGGWASDNMSEGWDDHLADAVLPVVEAEVAARSAATGSNWQERAEEIPESERCESTHPDKNLRCKLRTGHWAHRSGGDAWYCACDLNTERAEEAEAAVKRARELARHPRISHGRVNDYVPAADLRAALDRPEET